MWTYQLADGEVVARVRRDDVPPIGWPVRICGDGGPVRHYHVASVDEPTLCLVLQRGAV